MHVRACVRVLSLNLAHQSALIYEMNNAVSLARVHLLSAHIDTHTRERERALICRVVVTYWNGAKDVRRRANSLISE